MLEAALTGAKLSKEAFEQLEPGLRLELLKAQIRLRERSDRSVLVLLAGDDRVGCNEIFDRLHEWLDARHLVARTFVDPTEDQLERPGYFRFVTELPPKGKLGLFFGGWPRRDLADCVRGRIDDEQFERRIQQAQRFERMLAADGTVLLKLWVHLPKKEHKKRLKRAARNPDEEFLVEELDREILERMDEGLPEVETYLEATHTAHAPWRVIAGSDDERRDIEVGRAVLEALTSEPEPPGPSGERTPATPKTAPPPPTLAAVDLSLTLPKAEYKARVDELQAELARLSRAARAQGVSTVLAFEGWDAAGKGGAIRRLTQAMAARDYRVIPIAAPTPEELARNYLWRFWRQLPRAGRTVIFDRTWYGRVLVERIEGYAKAPDWQRAYAEIAEFEDQLAESGCILQKFWLHIDADEQLARFKAREQIPHKRHKITAEDYRNRDKWDAYAQAVDDMLARTQTAASPWHVISANDKYHARVRVLETVVEALRTRVS